jgi:UDP-N-acetylmuramoyl-L-alanyl-D-glutamate--2,6-diaminopimelate ligase
MKLDVLLSKFVPVPASLRGACPEVTSIADDSRAVTPGCLFVARSGTKTDGRQFVADAVAKGAVAIVHVGDDPCAGDPRAAAVVRVRAKDGTDLTRLVGQLADILEGNPSEWLRMVGITGTNGKTTMAFLVQQFVRAAGSPCGVIGTVVIDDGAVAEPANLTTPGGIETARALGRMVRNGCTACAMEVSSHALDQGRADALRFRTAIFSNLTGDHLDYHGTMEKYAAAKARLFRMLPHDGTAVVNADDPWHAAMLEGCRARVLRCSVRTSAEAGTTCASGACGTPADCTATIHASRLGWQDTTFDGPWGSVRVKLPIVGRHNAMNALEAAAAAWSIGVPAEAIARALAACQAPPGRLEPVTTTDDPFAVLVDYAHTDDALLNVLTALRPLVGPGGRLVAVFGCGGDRDRTKRPRMMRVACAHSDRVIVTSDNPRTEDPEAIIDEVMSGRPASEQGTPAAAPAVVRQADRARAIEQAVSEARPGDIVLIAGKGHEDYQIVGTEKRPFDDRLAARAALGRAPARTATVPARA